MHRTNYTPQLLHEDLQCEAWTLCVLQLNFVRFYLPLLAISNHEKIVYLDDDIIVQGMTASFVRFIANSFISNKMTQLQVVKSSLFIAFNK